MPRGPSATAEPTRLPAAPSPTHVAIIMDGNGRWALAQRRPREWGHRRGAEAVHRVVEAAPGLGIGVLTLYAFSSDNWDRPASEVATLMRLLRRYLGREAKRLAENGVRLRVVGRRDRLAPEVLEAIERAESATAHGERMTLRLAVDYSSRGALLQALRLAAASSDGGTIGPETLSALLGRATNGQGPSPDVDLLIRSGGERRLSDFLLWECAHADLHFTPVMWPDFTGDDLALALRDHGARQQRFGAIALAG